MSDFDYTPYIFNPAAEAPAFQKGDAPAFLRTENLSDQLSRLVQKSAEEDEKIDLKELPKGWKRLTSPRGAVNTTVSKRYLGGFRPPNQAHLKRPSEKHSFVEPSPSHEPSLGTLSNSIAVQELVKTHSSPTNLPDLGSEQRGRTQDVAPGQQDRLIPSAAEVAIPASATRASSVTCAEQYDDAADTAATHSEAFASIYYVDVLKSNTGVVVASTGIVSNENLEDWIKVAPSTDVPYIRLLIIPTVTNQNAMYISKDSFLRIVEEYGLPKDLAMFSQAPQMSTYHMHIPIGQDRVVFHARSAISISNASHLSYRYEESTKSINGILLDRRERSELFIKKLLSLHTLIGDCHLPMIALAQHALETSSRDGERTEDSYYLTKKIWSLVSSLTSPDKQDHFLPSTVKELQGLITTRRLQVASITNLLSFLKAKISSGDGSLISLLEALESVNDGNRLVTDRHQARHDELIASSQDHIQMELDRKTYRSAKSNEASLKRTEEILVELTMINERTRRIIDDQRSLAEKQRDLQREAGVNGRLTAVLAVVAALSLPASTVAAVFQMYQFKSWVFWLIVPCITLLLLGVTGVIWKSYHLVFALLEKETDSERDKEKTGLQSSTITDIQNNVPPASNRQQPRPERRDEGEIATKTTVRTSDTHEQERVSRILMLTLRMLQTSNHRRKLYDKSLLHPV